MLKKDVNLKINDITCFILLKSFFRLYLANSGMRRPAQEVMIIHGNIKSGIVIPFIKPYCERAVLQDILCFSKLNGISSCFILESPERMYEVIATGKEILKIFF